MLRRLPILILLIVTWLAAPVSEILAQDLVSHERASGYVEEGRFQEAIALLNTIITPETMDMRALLLRASAHEGRRDFAGAVRDYARVLEINPTHVEARDGLRRTQQQPATINHGNLESMRRLVKANPNSLSYRIRYADALLEARLYRKAADEYREYLSRTQGTPDVLQSYLIAIANYEGDNAVGERTADKYVRIYTNNDDLWMRLGYFRLWQGKYRPAREAFDQALRLNPNNQEARNGLGFSKDPGLARTQSRFPIDVLTRELNTDPGQDAKRFELIDLLIDDSRYFEARQHLAILAPRHGGSPSWTRRSTLLENRLQTEPAPAGPSTFIVDRLIRDVNRNPNDSAKRFRLIEELIKYDRNMEAYDNLILLAPEYGKTERWLALFVATDDGLIETRGESPIFQIDRLTYRLRYNPSDQRTRYRLVDELVYAERYTEAYETLIDPRYADPTDEGYRGRLVAITETRLHNAQQRIIELEESLAERPDDKQALRDIIGQYKFVGRVDDAVRTYVALIGLEPENLDLRAEYVEALRTNGYQAEAVEQSGYLVEADPANTAFQRLFVLSMLANRELDARGESYLALLLSDPDSQDSELMLDAADYRLYRLAVEEADMLTTRAEEIDDPRFGIRIETLKHLIARARLRLNEADQVAILNEARRFVAAKRYAPAIDAYERYFNVRGRRTRAELIEFAQVHAAAEDFAGSISILEALQAQQYEYGVEREIARTKIARKDFSGALANLERLQADNPRDYEVRFMQADALRGLGLYAQAEAIYIEAQQLAVDSRMIDERKIVIGADVRAAIAESGEWLGYDWVGIVVPTTEAVRARGGGTRYDRWAQGMQTQVTLPIGMILTAGVKSHFISGTRRLVPNSEIVHGRINQIFTGGYIDLTPPLASQKETCSNRIIGEIGLYDYEGTRTTAYGGIRYCRQELGKYQASIGVRTGEGAIDLWSPGGGQFNLQLTQFNLRGSSVTLMPDSVLRVNGTISLNVVRDNFGNTATANDTNFGTNIHLEAGYRIVDNTYLGLNYYQIDYRSTVDIYFSPRNYESYDLFLEYEKDVPHQWYLRVRGAMGIIARSSGFISRRIEADLVKKLSHHFSLTVSTSMGQSTRTLGSGATSFIDRYNTFTFAAALYWTL